MKRCQKIPRPGTGGDWYRRWHALRCAECRAAGRADRKLARGLQALRQPPVPAGPRADLLERLGLPAAEAEMTFSSDRGRVASPVARVPWAQGSAAKRVLSLVRYPVIAAGAAALLVAFGLILRWADHDGPEPPRGSEIARRVSAGMAPARPFPGESRGIQLPAGPIAALSPVIRVARLPDVAGRGPEQGASPQLVPPAHQPVVASRPAADDLRAVNGDPVKDARWWAPLRSDDWKILEEQVRRTVEVRDDFVHVPFPQVAAASDRQIAQAVESYKREAAVMDPRLSREVALQVKATALSDLCEQLRTDTGIQMAAGQSVADEKVTLFCRKMPLRDVMRQLSRPFGYTWLRSRKSGEYRYELVQDLRSQLLEEELRNRDRNEALLALDREIGRYRPYLGLTPDEALARSKTATPVEKKLLEKLASAGWGPIQMYSRLSAQDLAAMRAGQRLSFAQEFQPGYRALPPDVARGVLQTFRSWHLIKGKEGWELSFDTTKPGATPVPQVPDARASLNLAIKQSELGRMALNAGVFWYTVGSNGLDNGGGGTSDNYVDAVSPTVAQPDNTLANAKMAQAPVLRPRVTVRPRPSCSLTPLSSNPYVTVGTTPEPRVTTGDVLEVVHRATGLPIVADYYTRLYNPEAVSAHSQPLLERVEKVAAG